MTNETSVTFTIRKGDSVVVEDVAIDQLDAELIKLDAGDYSITIMNAESDNYNASDAFKVVKAGSSVVINSVTDGVFNTAGAVVDYVVTNETGVTFTIKKDVFWHDGEKVIADDVLFTISLLFVIFNHHY